MSHIIDKSKDDYNVSIWFALYPSDFLADTSHLNNEEIGIYVKFLCKYWRDERGLKNHDNHLSKIAGITPRKWKAMRPNLENLFIIDDDCWHHKALSGERYKATLNRMQKRLAGYIKNGNTQMAEQIRNQMDEIKCAGAGAGAGASADKFGVRVQCPLPSPLPLPKKTSIQCPNPTAIKQNHDDVEMIDSGVAV